MSANLSEIDVVLLDSYSLFFRAFHAFPLTLTSPTGEYMNAVFGFTRLLLELLERVHPQYLIAAVDLGKPTFRHTDFEDYKANRPEAPQEIKEQFPYMRQILDVLDIPTIGVEGFEADDVIGTLTKRFTQEYSDLEVGIFTGDKDSYQLVGENIFVLRPGTKPKEGLRVIDEEAVIDSFGVKPSQVCDYKALCGDQSDNIPGVKGVGAKTAQKLLASFHDIRTLYQALAQATDNLDWAETIGEPEWTETESQQYVEMAHGLKARLVLQLTEGFESAWMSRHLAKISLDVPLQFELQQAHVNHYDKAAAIALFEQLGFRSLIKHLPQDQFESAVQESLF